MRSFKRSGTRMSERTSSAVIDRDPLSAVCAPVVSTGSPVFVTPSSTEREISRDGFPMSVLSRSRATLKVEHPILDQDQEAALGVDQLDALVDDRLEDLVLVEFAVERLRDFRSAPRSCAAYCWWRVAFRRRRRFGSFAAHANVRLEVEHCRAELDTVARAQRVLGHQEVVHERAVEAADIAQESLRSAAPELAVAAGQARIVQPERVFRSTAGARRIILQLEDAVPVPTLDDQLRQGSPPVYPQAGQRTAGC